MGGWVTYEEGRAYIVTGTSASENILGIADGQAGIGLSTLSHKTFLLHCARALAGYSGTGILDLSDVERARVAEGCSVISSDALAASPASSFAHYVRAAVAANNQDWPTFAEAFRLSQLTGSSEAWIADWRIQLAEAAGSEQMASVEPYYEGDLKLLVDSYSRIQVLVRRFVTNSGFRDLMTRLLETMDADDQQRFLNRVRNRIG